jgi:hypothetical protein
MSSFLLRVSRAILLLHELLFLFIIFKKSPINNLVDMFSNSHTKHYVLIIKIDHLILFSLFSENYGKLYITSSQDDN